MSSVPSDRPPLISVVLPAYEEGTGILAALDEIGRVLERCNVDFEMIVVDDGSRDDTFAAVATRAARDPRIRGLRFSRNFGKEAALWAGLRAAGGDAVVTMDADLQHPPALLPEMIEAWRRGARVVHAVKQERPGDGPLVRLRARLFNRLMLWLAGIDLTEASDFKLLDREVADILARRMPERERFYRGLAAWVGYPSAEVRFAVADRASGRGKWSSLRLLDLAVTALVSFTSAPLRIVTALGVLTLALSGVLVVDTLWSWLHGRAVSGFATIIITLLIIGSCIMISLGIIGEYIAKVYEEVKRRPPYLVSDTVNLSRPPGEIAETGDAVPALCRAEQLAREGMGDHHPVAYPHEIHGRHSRTA
jgi:glycosyltransferase involved in cell wall biosynthesis